MVGIALRLSGIPALLGPGGALVLLGLFVIGLTIMGTFYEASGVWAVADRGRALAVLGLCSARPAPHSTPTHSHH